MTCVRMFFFYLTKCDAGVWSFVGEDIDEGVFYGVCVNKCVCVCVCGGGDLYPRAGYNDGLRLFNLRQSLTHQILIN